jgi:hypothetical protein
MSVLSLSFSQESMGLVPGVDFIFIKIAGV